MTQNVFKRPTMWLILAATAGLFYLAVSGWGYGYVGFPLDDAWIHQTYARNLAESGQLAFVTGVPSAGSTAPLWSLLLGAGYWLNLPPLAWTYGLGILLLGLTGWTVNRLAQRLFPGRPAVGVWAGLFCVLEWHLVWAAVSGMETMLFVWLSVWLVERYLAAQPLSSRRALGLGLIGGLLILTRPEGVGVLGLVGLDLARRGWRQTPRPGWNWLLARWLAIGAGAALLLGPYVLFHLRLTGLPFPSTFYAKQAEYGQLLRDFSLWWRLFGNFGPPVETVQGVFRVIFIGPQVLLLPGLGYAAWLTFKERRAELWLIWLWWVSFLLLYGLRLPVTYQHGRYQMPVIVWVVLLGGWGTARLVAVQQQKGLIGRVVSRALVASLGLLLLLFVGVGAQAYSRDVRFIETEMVATARWLNLNTPPEAVIAAHDIGAIGYFSRRPLIDLAGLVTPAIIPIIRDEAALWQFMQAHGAAYLVTFPSWYPQLSQNPALTRQFVTDAPWVRQLGGDNMAVYRVGQP